MIKKEQMNEENVDDGQLNSSKNLYFDVID